MARHAIPAERAGTSGVGVGPVGTGEAAAPAGGRAAFGVDAGRSHLLRRRRRVDRFFHGLCLAATLTGLAVLVVLLADVLADGWRHLDWHFLTSFASRLPERAGIYAALMGSLWVIGVAAPLLVIVGVGTAVYLEEYGGDGPLARLIKINIDNLAGVPSIIYGILGLALFVRGLGLGPVVLAGALTMALLVLPVVIVATQEALRAVPASLRHASYALGATRWQTTWRVVLPAALPGILTGIILALSRAIGETAPLIVVGAVTYVRFVPSSLFDPYTVLPIQIYSWITMPREEFKELAAAGIVVLLGVLLCMNGAAIYLRNRYQQRW
ncbi:phosphate ABC transporter permease PstA [Thermaerobacter composti]|uniref:Phosphate transport system permease protein PstA n=1 Tax=Thermaerobacter composti TaxID=554949 RepID=A0ABZ0QLK4_9FIRM|nr:phosphate ABC transporter permease PstA [Thermaerobacter composti]PZN09481.1 MAG: phosphate ABC transporter permease PtsA [Bacillota bacterium]WPD18376.1 phosphate ABC transporter permease PstA [Thermaerobacter composti]